MRNFKRVLSIALELIMAVVCFAGCKSSKADYVIYSDNAFAPFEFLGDNDKYVGIDMDILAAVAEDQGFTYEMHNVGFDAAMGAVQSGQADAMIAGMTITDERKENMGISEPYMQNKQVLVVKAENLEKFSDAANFADAKIVAESKSAGETVATTDELFKDSVFTAVDTQAKTLMEVKSGTADAAILDYVASIGMIGEGTDYDMLTVVEKYEFSPEQYGIAFRKDDNEMREKFQKAIDELMEDGTIEKIAKKYKLDSLLVK